MGSAARLCQASRLNTLPGCARRLDDNGRVRAEMLCCSAPSRQQRRPPRPAGTAPETTAAQREASRLKSSADAPDATSERKRQILVQFPGKGDEFREVSWSEDPTHPLTMDGIKDLLRQADPSGSCARSTDFDVLDDDGDAILAPSTWPPGVRVTVSLDGQLNATCQGAG